MKKRRDFFKAIRSLMVPVEGSNNYDVNMVMFSVYDNYIHVEGICVNEYGGGYGNADAQDICAEDMPNWLWNRLADLKQTNMVCVYKDGCVDIH